MSDLLEYDADQVRIAAFGAPISKGAGASGYAEGPFCTIEQTEKAFTVKKGTDGTYTRSKTNARLTVVKIRLMQSCATNAVLSAMLALDEAQPNGAGVGTLVVQDLQGTSIFAADKVWVSGPAVQVYDAEAMEREWELHAIRRLLVVGGN